MFHTYNDRTTQRYRNFADDYQKRLKREGELEREKEESDAEEMDNA